MTLGFFDRMLARSLSRMAVLSRRGLAAAAAQQKNTEELRLTFASPDAAFFNNAVVKQVDVPTLAGMVGVLANHVPTIGVLKPGVVSVTDNEGNVTKLFVSSGTLSMNIDGTCQVLAEEVVKIEDIDQAAARTELEAAQRAAVEGSELAKAEALIRAEVADALLKAATGQQ
ncbi:ATP synthase F1, epsilon subunit [Teladorsagia circumcincta]|uniref:F-ATPase delta subunit n=1 Tax=Teladorsagia circumcincta TaxID=45464 RepID=A0A2G9UYE7_TELCI|nr:ATP synthase F1, epsilon subunit [Teladorsagia circumcincta]